MKARFSMVVLAGALLLPALGAQAQTVAESDSWKFSVMPYLWLPAVDGKLRFGPPPVGGGSANVELDAGNYLDPGINQPGAAGNVGAPGVGHDPGINQPGAAGNRRRVYR
jgi:hypothetical protein